MANWSLYCLLLVYSPTPSGAALQSISITLHVKSTLMKTFKLMIQPLLMSSLLLPPPTTLRIPGPQCFRNTQLFPSLSTQNMLRPFWWMPAFILQVRWLSLLWSLIWLPKSGLEALWCSPDILHLLQQAQLTLHCSHCCLSVFSPD